MSILTVINDALEACEQAKVTTVVGATDPIVLQMLNFAKQEGDITSKKYDWRNLDTACTITGDGTSTLFYLPSDFGRFTVRSALWSSSYQLAPLIGPVSDEDFLNLKARLVVPFRPVWRLIGGAIEIWPALASGEVVSGNYRSAYWVTNLDGSSRQARFQADTDAMAISEMIVTLGSIWRWKTAKGLSSDSEKADWAAAVNMAAAHNGGGVRVTNMSTSVNPYNQTWNGPALVSTVTGINF